MKRVSQLHEGVQKTVISATYEDKSGDTEQQAGRGEGGLGEGVVHGASAGDFSRFSWQNSRFPILSVNESLDA